MAVFYKLTSRLVKKSRLSTDVVFVENQGLAIRKKCTMIGEAKPARSVLKYSLFGAGFGVLLGVGYAYNWKNRTAGNFENEGKRLADAKVLKIKPEFTPSRQVRVLLDYYGLSYDVVEVDPVLRKEIGWSPYKKVPILLAKIKGGYQPLNDSSMITSLLTSFLLDKSYDIDELAKYYPSIEVGSENGSKSEIVNKYFLMFKNGIPEGKSMNDIIEERNWRKWADEVLVHSLSPNIYRTLEESYESFNWFSKVGRWEEYFPTWERLIMINVGALAMYFVSKRLKKRHGLKDDVRLSLYENVNQFLKAVKVRGSTFMGGQNPDLSDIAVYGILKSIEGCRAFEDLIQSTKLKPWYDAMTEKINQHEGSSILQ